MTVLLSSSQSKIAHLSYDGEHTACGTLLLGDTVRGPSMGFVGATACCGHCPTEAFAAYFDKLRRGIMYQAHLDEVLG